MQRFFGSGKPKAPPPTLTDVIANTEGRAESVDKKIAKLDVELKKLKDQMAKMRDGPGKNMVKQRALRLLQQKKAYQSQLGNLQSQVFNMEQTNFATQSLKDTQAQVSAMKSGLKEMKKEFKTINVSQVEDLQDDMQDLMEQHDEIQDILSRNYTAPEVEDEDLEAEFEALGDLTLEDDMFDEALAPGVPTHNPAQRVPAAAAPAAPTGPVAVDEFGLPQVPAT